MAVERVWLLLARKLAGEATREELDELEKFIQDDPGLRFKIESLTKIWATQPVKREEEYRADRIWERIKESSWQAVSTEKENRVAYYFLKKNYMFSNYFKIAWRNLTRAKAFSLINIIGLAIGMASAVLILLWIQNEVSYDSFHSKKDRIYQAYSRGVFDGKTQVWDGTSMLLGPLLELKYPEVEATTRMNWVAAFIFHAGDKHLQSEGYLTDPAFLKIFDFPLLQGDQATALSSARSLVITETFAKKLFGTTDVMGKMVKIDSSSNFMVTGVIKDLPNNTHFNFEYLVPWSYMKEVHWDRNDWETSYIGTYVLLKPGVTEETANTRIQNFIKTQTDKVKTELFLHPISKWRLWSEFENGKISGGYIKTVRLFGIIAAFILLIACINYMNLSTARSVKRAREVGIRKVAGARKGSLIGQFLGESILVAFIAGMIALLIVQAGLGWFNELTQKKLVIPFDNVYFWLSYAGFILLTGALAGSYPAFYLSDYKPIRVLKGSFKGGNALVTPRKVMVVVQFTFAIVFIISTIIIQRQIKYGQARDAGFNQNNLAFVFLKGDLQKKYETISQELLASGAITAITRTNSPITQVWNGDDSYEWPGKKPGELAGFALFHTDKDFAKTMGLTVIAGRDINAEKYPTDSNGIMVTETAAKLMKFKDPIGQPVKSQEGNWHIVGVVKDFVPGNPFGPPTPIVIQGPGEHHWYGTMTFKMNPQNTTSANLETIGAILKKYNPEYPFDYYFTDEAYAAQFEGAQHTGSLAGTFAGLTIFISCLGLFALAAYMAESRTKEIGVRKVLGASVVGISTLLSKDFLKLVIIAFVIASPLAWWAMNSWLQDYPYRVGIDWWIFGLTALISIVIAGLTVSFQAIKAAIANPVKSLRTE